MWGEESSLLIQRILPKGGVKKVTMVKPSTTAVSISHAADEKADESGSLTIEQMEEQIKLQQEVFNHILLNGQLYGGKHDVAYVGSGTGGGMGSSLASNSWSFTQGLLLGQLSVFVVIAIFIKFFVFAEQSNIVTSKAAEMTSKLKQNILGVIVKRNKKRKNFRNCGSPGGDADKSVPGRVDGDASDSEEEDNSFTSKISSILEKTYYDVDNHAPESLDWFNVLIAQMISQLRAEALVSDNIYHSLNDFLSNLSMPDYLDTIKLTEIDVGDDFPIFSNCRINETKLGGGGLEAKIDVDLSDTLTLGIETKLLLNHPLPLTAVLPVQLSVLIVRFSGCLTVSLVNTNDQEIFKEAAAAKSSHSGTKSTVTSTPVTESTSTNTTASASSATTIISNTSTTASTTSTPPPAPSTPVNQTQANQADSSNSKSLEPAGTALMFLFSPDYRLEFTVKSLIGARAKLQDVPKISSLIENRLRSWFVERCIEPRYQVVKLPSLWPRSKNTREPVNGGTESRKSELPKV